MSRTAIVILAAGNSSRLGSPKQLLAYKQNTLIGHTIKQLIEIPSSKVFVVLGAYADEIEKELYGVYRVYNPEWQSGMGKSLSKAVEEITKEADFDQLLITLCDLPLLEHNYYQALLQFHLLNKNSITRTVYPNVKGVPVIFDCSYFSELLELTSEEGAKTVLQKHTESISDFHWPEPYFDVDTLESYQELLLKNNAKKD